MGGGGAMILLGTLFILQVRDLLINLFITMYNGYDRNMCFVKFHITVGVGNKRSIVIIRLA